jgi:outer membrane protein OmpA-like peptidoglycan-associated protein
MKSPVNFLIASLLLWMCGSTYYYVTNIKFFANESTSFSLIVSKVEETLSEAEVIEKEIAEGVGEVAEEKALVEKEISIDNKTVYFDFGSNNLTLDDGFESYIDELNTYMDEHTNQSIWLIGHTDSSGSESVNTLMGMERAEFVKSILVQAGVDGNQIKTESKGEKEASSSSDTREGRSTDRRVEIITK